MKMICWNFSIWASWGINYLSQIKKCTKLFTFVNDEVNQSRFKSSIRRGPLASSRKQFQRRDRGWSITTQHCKTLATGKVVSRQLVQIVYRLTVFSHLLYLELLSVNNHFVLFYFILVNHSFISGFHHFAMLLPVIQSELASQNL